MLGVGVGEYGWLFFLIKIKNMAAFSKTVYKELSALEQSVLRWGSPPPMRGHLRGAQDEGEKEP